MLHHGPVHITVVQTDSGDPMVFHTAVEVGGRRSQHRVTLRHATLRRLVGNSVEPIDCVRAALRFLIEREAPSDILPSFDINVINLYFPSFARELPSYVVPERDAGYAPAHAAH